MYRGAEGASPSFSEQFLPKGATLLGEGFGPAELRGPKASNAHRIDWAVEEARRHLS